MLCTSCRIRKPVRPEFSLCRPCYRKKVAAFPQKYLCKDCGSRKRALLPYQKPDGSEGHYRSKFCTTCKNRRYLAASNAPPQLAARE